MPYRRKGKTVQKQTPSGRWVREKTHTTTEQAKRHLTALLINVEGKHRNKPKRRVRK